MLSWYCCRRLLYFISWITHLSIIYPLMVGVSHVTFLLDLELLKRHLILERIMILIDIHQGE